MFSRFAVGFGFVVLLLVTGLVAVGVHFMSGTVPRVEGSALVTGISANAQIDRDQFAIPHIHASTERDAWFALGYAEAQDRLFQMEFSRRVGQGRTAEMFGPKTVMLDEWSRTIGFARIAQNMWTKCGAHSRDVLTAFTNGINARIRESGTRLGFEFDALKLVPEYWKPEDCLIMARLMSWEMNFAYLSDAAFSDFQLALDSNHLHSLFPNYPEDGATVLDGPDPKNFVSNYWNVAPVPATSLGIAVAAPVVTAIETAAAPLIVSPPPVRAPTIATPKPTAPKAALPKAVAPKTAPPKPKTAAPKPNATPAPKTPPERPAAKPPTMRLPKPPIRIGANTIPAQFFAELRRVQKSIDSILGPQALTGGSNAFAIAPARSATGGAILENDTHLKLESPSRWYLAHITTDDGLNVAGFLIPGLPIFVIGRTLDLSWGVTNAMADETDFFIEKTDSTGTKYIAANGTPQPFTIVHDTIRIRDSSGGAMHRQLFNVFLSSNGPIVSAIHPDSIMRYLEDDKRAGAIPDTTIFRRQRPVALMWNGLFSMSDEIGAFVNLLHAKTVSDARAGMSSFATPCLNLCLADAHGNVAYQYIGRMPRRTGNEERIMLPRDGTNASDAWQGFITMSQLPSSTNPPRGYIVSANNPPVKARAFAYSNCWEPSSRADRISELIERSGRISTGDVARIQTDVISPYDVRRVLQYILKIYPDPHPPRVTADSTSLYRLDSMQVFWKHDSIRRHGSNVSDSMFAIVLTKDSAFLAAHRPPEDTIKTPKTDPFTTLVLEYLRNWDGGMRPEEIAPAIYSMFLNRLLFHTFSATLGSERYAEFMSLENIPLNTLARILPDTNNIWWQDGCANTISWGNASGLDVATNPRDSMIVFCFRESLRILGSTFGRDIRQWQWGRMHTLTFRHPFSKSSSLISRIADIPAGPAPGGPTTPLQATYHLWGPYEEIVGPSMRMISDMKTSDMLAVLPTGNSEAIFGDHYRDMLDLYKKGELVRLSLTQHGEGWRRFELRAQ